MSKKLLQYYQGKMPDGGKIPPKVQNKGLNLPDYSSPELRAKMNKVQQQQAGQMFSQTRSEQKKLAEMYRKEYEKNQMMQNAPLAQTIRNLGAPGQITQAELNASGSAAQMIGDATPFMSGRRAVDALYFPLNNAYYNPNQTAFERGMGALTLAGDVANLGPFVKSGKVYANAVKQALNKTPKPNIGVDDVGIFTERGGNKYYELGNGFGNLKTPSPTVAPKTSKSVTDPYIKNQASVYTRDAGYFDRDIIGPWIRSSNTREFGDEMRGAMKKYNLEPTNPKDVEKFRKLFLKEQENYFFKNQRPVNEHDILEYHLNNTLNQNKYGGSVPKVQNGGQLINNKNNNMYYMTGGMYADGGEADSQEQIITFIAQSIQQGADPEAVVEKLVEAGVPQNDAVEIVQSVMQQLQQAAGQQQSQQQPQQQMKMGGNPGVYSDGYSGTFSGGNYFQMGGGFQPGMPTNTGKGRAALLKFVNGGLNYADNELNKMLTGEAAFEVPVNMPFHSQIPEYTVGGYVDPNFSNRRGVSQTDFTKGGEYDLSEAEVQDLINRGFKIQYV